MLLEPNIRLMRRGTAIQAGAAGQNAALYLFNDSLTGQLVRLWALIAAAAGGTGLLQGYVREGAIGTLQNKGTPLVAGDPSAPGAIYSAANDTTLNFDSYFHSSTGGVSGFFYRPRHPIVILPAGWTFGLVNNDQNANIYSTFFWDSVPSL